jgi:hypothetical protein
MSEAQRSELAGAQGSAPEVRSYKHYCRACHAMHFIAVTADSSSAEYPACCGRRMAYLGVVDARPGRDESLMRGKLNVPAQPRDP